MILCLLFFLSVWASPLIPQNTGEESYSETYTAFADIDDGTYILVQFLFSNAGLGSNKAVCRILIVPADKEGMNRSAQYSSSEWKGNDDKLRVGSCMLQKVNQTTKMIAVVDDLQATLRFSSSIQKRQFQDARIQVQKNDFYEQDILIVSSKVQAEWSIQGKRSSGEGFAQLDHTRSNTILPKVAKKWFRFRGFRGKQPMFAQVRIDPKGKKYGWVYSLQADTALEPTKMNIGMDSLLYTKEGTFSITPSRAIYEYKPLEAYGMMGALAKAWIGNPVTRTYRGVGTYQGAHVEGILEIVEIEE